MSGEIENLEEVIGKITQQVTERLQSMGVINNNYVSGNKCDATGETCQSKGLCEERKAASMKRILDLGAVRLSGKPGAHNKASKLAGMIDHTLLAPDTTKEDLIKVCEEARNYSFATVCVNASNIPLVARLLRGSGVKPIAVVGFPLGAATATSKAFEAKEAVRAGAREIDMVINIGALKSKDFQTVFEDIYKVVSASAPYKTKVILEMASLTEDEKIIGCALSKAAGAAFVKTSTGFGKGGATVDDVRLMRRIVGGDMEVKASGGVRTTEDAKNMIDAGADRIGASASIAIVTGKKSGTSNY